MIEIGQKFGAWEVLEKLDYKQKYRCICTACMKTVQHVRSFDLVHGKTLMCKSCSSSKDQENERPIEYHSWVAMLQRCYNPNCKDYPNYGGRGITVDPLWKESFEVFLMSMGSRPAPHYTIERRDVNGNYEPGNCLWIAKEEQPKNQRNNVRLTIDGITQTVSDWSNHENCTVNRFTIYKRLHRGWSPKEAVFTPSKKDENG